MTLPLILFLAGVLTILLPCILPLIPIVLGVSIAGQSKLRPLAAVLGMVVSFVGFTFLLLVLLRQFVEVADYMRIGTYYVLLLFGLGFASHNVWVQRVGAIAGGFFFLEKGIPSVLVVAIVGVLAMKLGGKVATSIQNFGTSVQGSARERLGNDNPLTPFIMGLTMGLVWVPCAGPALGFAFTLVREQPGLQAFFLLLSYALGTAVPLLLIGYGGQYAVHSVRFLSRYSGRIKEISGWILILTALSFQFHIMRNVEIWLVQNTSFGTLGTRIEESFLADQIEKAIEEPSPNPTPNPSAMHLPKIARAPEFQGLGPWHNSEPLTLESLKGKVVLIDFWTYSCINCIRTLPHIQGYAETFADAPFVLLGVHTPEFVFEKSEKNVADAIERHGLTYPSAQDNDFETWRAFANRYWPAKYLIDANGYIRYTHFGEGAYEETEEAIRVLLEEAGWSRAGVGAGAGEDEVGRRYNEQSPETYLGERSWPALLNGAAIPTSDVVSYEPQEEVPVHKYQLSGEWQMVDREKQVLKSSEGEIRMRFLGGEINLVMGMLEGHDPATVTIKVDGKEVKSFVIDKYDLFELWKGEYGNHEIAIKISGEGAEGYAFTFGQ